MELSRASDLLLKEQLLIYIGFRFYTENWWSFEVMSCPMKTCVALHTMWSEYQSVLPTSVDCFLANSKDLNKICLLCYHSWNKEWWRFSSESSSFGGRRKGLEAPPRVVESSSSVRGRRRRGAQGPPSNQTHFHPFLLLTWDKRTTTWQPRTSEVMWKSATF